MASLTNCTSALLQTPSLTPGCLGTVTSDCAALAAAASRLDAALCTCNWRPCNRCMLKPMGSWQVGDGRQGILGMMRLGERLAKKLHQVDMTF